MATRLRDQGLSTWPIMPGSERPPANWAGWPGGAKFALVLTHDVEGPRGLENCRRLAQLEREQGLRSSFNFIPEGQYRVSAKVREELVRDGFEIGIHDLEHDGRLYRSRSEFTRKAARINGYLQDWGASGFRSGFMLHNLNWLHDLKIKYDMSTFDTDPFEPQPDGHHTIFPFWVARPESQSEDSSPLKNCERGYVELPYTLPQDSTLYLLLREQTIDIWIRKLRWIAEHGGMALVNIHPDYVDFGDQASNRNHYPASHVREFFDHVLSSYRGTFWNACPGEVAEWYQENRFKDRLHRTGTAGVSFQGVSAKPLHRPLAGKRAAVLLYSYYPSDPRPRRAAEALAAAGMEVDLICLRGGNAERARETVAGVRVIRLPLQKQRNSKFTYLRKYAIFLVACFGLLGARSLRRRYDLVHVHNMPDVLVLSALFPKLRGARVILDLHDPMPELMLSIYNLPSEDRLVRLLKTLERVSVDFADLVLTPNEAFRALFISRGCAPEKIQIVMNSPQEDIFNAASFTAVSEAGPNGSKPFKLMYHGLIAERHGLDTALQAAALLKATIPSIEFHIFGHRTSYMEWIDQLVEELGLQANVHYHGHQPQNNIARAIVESDLGLIPNRRNPFTEINMPTRIFEYVAMGKPVVVPNTKGIRDYFADDSALFFEPGDPHSLAAVIEQVCRDPQKVAAVVAKGRGIYELHRWEIQKTHFLEMVSSLLSPDETNGRIVRDEV